MAKRRGLHERVGPAREARRANVPGLDAGAEGRLAAAALLRAGRREETLVERFDIEPFSDFSAK